MLPASSSYLTPTVVLSRDSTQVYTPYLQLHLQCLENGIRSWQEEGPNPQWPYPIPSDNDPINQPIFLAYTRQSSIGWSHALQGPRCLHWGLLCPPLCCRESQTIPLNPLNGPGHSSGLYKSILTVNGLAIAPMFMGHATHLPGPHTGFP